MYAFYTHTDTHKLFVQIGLTPVCVSSQLTVKGYNDKQHILLKKIVEKMATFEIDEKRFDIIKEAVSEGPFLPHVSNTDRCLRAECFTWYNC